MKKYLLSTCVCIPIISLAAGKPGEIDEIIIQAKLSSNEVVDMQAASVGTVISEQIAKRPLLRPTEVLETVPGMVITQHSGGGKANQYFLRGFNLDHSSDFANSIEGAPVNLVSHAHSHGYSDFNFLIPELIDYMTYRKGPYFVDSGDFSTAGSANIVYLKEKQQQLIQFTQGEDNYQRALLTGGIQHNSHNWLYAFEYTYDDGPWQTPDQLTRYNGLLKYHHQGIDHSFTVSALAFDSSWQGTDQIPQRLVKSGELDRYGSLDNSTGGETHRHQLSIMGLKQLASNQKINYSAYWVDYALDLAGNFTYFSNEILDESPFEGVEVNAIGDQILQQDNRWLTGGEMSHEYKTNHHTINTGITFRIDQIKDVGIGKSFQKWIYEDLSRAKIFSSSQALYSQINSQWVPWLSTQLGVRYNYFYVDVTNKLNDQQKTASDQLLSPKFSAQFGPFKQTRFFLNYGEGFHSNDARGVVNDNIPLLAESQGYEIGANYQNQHGLSLTATAFVIKLDSELVFVGDDGTTEPKDASKRQGIELSLFYQPTEFLVIDADFTEAEAKFSTGEYKGNYVPDSIDRVISFGVTLDLNAGFYSGIRGRYFGPRKLTEIGDISSKPSTMLNANIGYDFNFGLGLGLAIINLTNEKADDITYYYESRTQEERLANISPQLDFHSHPMIERTYRVTLKYQF